MPIQTFLISYAKRCRDILRALPTNRELALAPEFKRLVEDVLAHVQPAAALTVVPEYATPSVGRPDLALTRAGQRPRAFIELKEPRKSIRPDALRGHDKLQFQRFSSLPIWALSNFTDATLIARGSEVSSFSIVPAAALNPTTSDTRAEAAIRSNTSLNFEQLISSLATAVPPVATNALEAASNLAHAARLVRGIISDALSDMAAQGQANGPLQEVRAEFREVLFAHPKAGGYPDADFDQLFAAAFAQTLAFGLLLVRDATGQDVNENSWNTMPTAHPLMRSTLRVLSQPEIVDVVGVGFDVMIDTVNSIAPRLLHVSATGRDPILYFYEDFLEVFDPEMRQRHGVFYTPIEVVRYQIAAIERVLAHEFALPSGLNDPSVTILDPAVGTGTYLVATAERAADQAEQAGGTGLRGPALRDLATRIFGFELLVGAYAVAHFRLHHALTDAARNVSTPLQPLQSRVNVFLADTLAEPGAAAPAGRLGFASQAIVGERAAADHVKQGQPVLVIVGNPPYRRLREGETAELVGRWMSELWDDLKEPVRQQGWGGELNTFPDLYIAFWRWSIWRLFEAAGATQKGVICLITNRTYLAGHPYAGLRKMLRERFDRIEIIDLRGDLRRGARAGVVGDTGVFDIQAGTAILLAWADGNKSPGALATVSYRDAWAAGAFSADEKIAWLRQGHAIGALPGGVQIARGLLDDFKPRPFEGRDWPSLEQCLTFKWSGIQTKRDDAAYSFTPQMVTDAITAFVADTTGALDEWFSPTTKNSARSARAIPFDPALVTEIAYRPFDIRHLYNHDRYVDRQRPELQRVFGTNNVCMYALPGGTGAGPAVWCHALLPDYHAFRGSYGGYAFPLYDRQPLGAGPLVAPALLIGLTSSYGRSVAPGEVFDAMLAILSAETYSRRFAEDLEDSFPHLPFPQDPMTFSTLVQLGGQIRELETFSRSPERSYMTAFVATADASAPILGSYQWLNDELLLNNGSFVIRGVSQNAWEFEVSGYLVVGRWLEHRAGRLSLTYAVLNQLLDLIGRVNELRSLMSGADRAMATAIGNPLTRAALGM